MGITFGFSGSSTGKSSSGTETSQKVLSQEAIDKLIYDVMSSDNGLAQLASSENLTGGSNSSSKTLLTQDFLTKIIGELANVTAETVKTSESTSKESNKSGGAKTVICTELVRQGKLSPELYQEGNAVSASMSPFTYLGYICWAKHVVPLMANSERLSNFLLPIAVARYEKLLGRRNSFIGTVAVYIGHPVCYLIGQVVSRFGGQNARASS